MAKLLRHTVLLMVAINSGLMAPHATGKENVGPGVAKMFGSFSLYTMLSAGIMDTLSSSFELLCNCESNI